MSNISCDVIKDLLPLYYDQVCSSESRKIVEEHIAGCSNCRMELEKIKEDINIQKETLEKNRSGGKAIKNIADLWKRSKTKAFFKGFIGAVVICCIIILSYIGLFKWQIISVPTDVVKITDVCQLKNGKIAYHVELTDGYALNSWKAKRDQDGNYYVTFYRPIIKRKPELSVGLHKMYYLFEEEWTNAACKEEYGDDIKVKALYIGNKKDNILIWKKGMHLPEASEKVEDNFYFGDEDN